MGGWAGLPWGEGSPIFRLQPCPELPSYTRRRRRSSPEQIGHTLAVLPRQPLRWAEKPRRGRVPEDGGDGLHPGRDDRPRGTEHTTALAVFCSCSYDSRSGREIGVITVGHWDGPGRINEGPQPLRNSTTSSHSERDKGNSHLLSTNPFIRPADPFSQEDHLEGGVRSWVSTWIQMLAPSFRNYVIFSKLL